MNHDRADAAWAVAVGADADSLERAGLDEVLVAIRLARSRLDAVELRVSRRLRYLAEQGRYEHAERAIADTTGRSHRDARDVTARDELCDDHPELEDALDAGQLTAAHLDAIHAAARNLPEAVRSEYLAHTDELMERAAHVSLDAFQRECRALARHCLAQSRRDAEVDELEQQRAASKVRRWVDRATGMHHTLLELDPVRDAKLDAAINRELARLRATDRTAHAPWQQVMVDATLNVLTGDVTEQAEPSGDGAVAHRRVVDRVPEITLVVDLLHLVDLAESSGLCETDNGVPIPASTVRRLCCDAEIIPVVMDGPSTVLDEGRSKRTATREQRRALRAIHRTCAHPGCTVGFDACRIHHVAHWLEHHGPTDLHNLLPLCERHHHMVHEGNWTLTLDEHRIATWTRPDGVIHHRGSTVDRRTESIGAPDERRRREPRTDEQLAMI